MALNYGLKGEMDKIDSQIDYQYQSLVLKEYAPIVNQIEQEAKRIMDRRGIKEIRLTPENLYYSRDYGFSHEQDRAKESEAGARYHLGEPCFGIKILPEIYINQSRDKKMNYCEGMRAALEDLISKLNELE